jgi:protein O-mannosyl-transferase
MDEQDHASGTHSSGSGGGERPEPAPGADQARSWLPLLVVTLAAAAVYANTLGNGLHVDDQYQIATNPWIRSFRNLPAVFSSGVWDFDGRVSSYYRPMMYVLYGLVYAVAGTAAWAYHLLNVLLHAGTASLAFLVARSLLAPYEREHPWWRSPALLVGLLFAVHPIHTEPVAWAAGVVDLAYGFFYLLAFYFVVRGGGRTRDLVFALAAYAAALLSKEPAITLPAVALIYWSFREGRQLGIRGLLRRAAPWAALSCGYLLLRSVALGGIAPKVAVIDLSPREYVLTALALLGRLLRAQVFPAELNFWHVFRPVERLSSPDAVLALVTVGVWVCLVVWALRRRALVPLVALAFAVLPLTPILLLRSIDQGLESAFAERYVYLPSFGVALLAGWAVAAVSRRRIRLARALTAGLAALVVLGAVETVRRNPVWRDAVSLWADTVAKSPGSGVANLNYGLALMSAGQADSGRRYVERGVSLTPDLVNRKLVRAVSYARMGRARDAILAFHVVLVMDPRSSQAHYNLGVLYEEQGQAAMAIAEYRAAIAADPGFADAHNNIGILYFTSGEADRGVQHLQEAVRLRPDDPGFRANLQRARAR